MNHLQKSQKSTPPDRQEPDWHDIERAYKAGSMTIKALAERHGVAAATISRRAKKNGWLRGRPGPEGPPSKAKKARATRSAREPAGTRGKTATKDLMRRMRRLLEHQIADIERSQKDDASVSDERSARTLSSMIRSLEKLLELEQTLANGPADKKGSDDSAPPDADRLRADLEQRLSRLAAG